MRRNRRESPQAGREGHYKSTSSLRRQSAKKQNDPVGNRSGNRPLLTKTNSEDSHGKPFRPNVEEVEVQSPRTSSVCLSLVLLVSRVVTRQSTPGSGDRPDGRKEVEGLRRQTLKHILRVPRMNPDHPLPPLSHRWTGRVSSSGDRPHSMTYDESSNKRMEGVKKDVFYKNSGTIPLPVYVIVSYIKDGISSDIRSSTLLISIDFVF